MYENKINSETLDKAIDQYLHKCFCKISAFPTNKFYSLMSEGEKNTLDNWLESLKELGLRINFVSSQKCLIVIEDQKDFQEIISLGIDLYFYCLEVNPAISASWLYEFYCKDQAIHSEFDLDKLHSSFVDSYREVDRIGKTHFLKIAVEKNAFVVAGLILAFLALLLISIPALCFLMVVGVVMSFFMHFVLAKRIYDEEMVSVILEKLKGAGEDESIRSVVISNTILVKKINSVIQLVKG